jgi:hypothetical protein
MEFRIDVNIKNQKNQMKCLWVTYLYLKLVSIWDCVTTKTYSWITYTLCYSFMEIIFKKMGW